MHERAGLERMIGLSRLVVALAALVATRLDTPTVPGLTAVASPLFIAYLAYAVSVVAFLRYRPVEATLLGPAIHGVDLFWATALTSVTGGPSSHFSPPLFIFAVLTAAFRWGLHETLVTGFGASLLLVAEAGAAFAGVLGTPLRPGDFVMRAVWLLLVAFVVGSLAERDRRLRADSILLGRIGEQVSVAAGLGGSVRAVGRELAQAFGAERALLVMEEATTGQLRLWTIAGSQTTDSDKDSSRELDRSEREGCLFPVSADAFAWGALRPRSGWRPREPIIRAFDADGHGTTCHFQIPDRLPVAGPWRSLMCLSSVTVEGWTGRFFIVNPAVDATDDQRLRTLATIWRQVGASLVNIDLQRRLHLHVAELNAARIEAVLDKKRLETVINTLPVGLAILDAQGGAIRTNQAFEKVWGGPLPATRTIDDFAAYKAWWMDTGRPVAPEEWASARAIRHAETVVGQIMQIERFNGIRLFVWNSAAPLFDAAGEVAGSVVLIQDITGRVTTERALADSRAALERANLELLGANERLRLANETLEQRVDARTAELKLRTSELQALAKELTRAEERERQRVADVIHDHLQQLLAAARINIGVVLAQTKAGPVQAGLREVDTLVAESLEVTRSLTAELSPAILHRSGLPAALRWLGRWYQDKHTLTVEVDVEQGADVEAEEIRITLFRGVRELLFNVVKHSGAKTARVRLHRAADDCVQIVVSDVGAGFDPNAVRAVDGLTGGLGLFRLRERLESIGGRFEVDSAPDRGASFTITAPRDAPGGPAN